MVSRWWEREASDDANAWDAEDFEQEVKASQERPPMPWQPAPATLQKPATGPATGPAAARAFGQEASRTLQDWQQAMLRLIRGPEQSPQAPQPAAQANSHPTAEQPPESPYGGPTGQPEQPAGPTQAPASAELLPWQRGIIAAARLPEPLAARVFQSPETTEGRQFAGGVGEAAKALGSGLEWAGLKGTGKTVREAGEKIVQEYPAEGPQFKDWTSFFDPEYLRTSAVRSMGTSAPTMVAGIAVALAAPAALGALGVGATAAVIGGAGASIGTSRILESLQEAGGTYQEAQQRGMDDTQAEEAARFTFLANLPLSAADAIQIIPFMRGLSGPVKAAVSKGLAQRVGPKAAGGLARALGIGASAASEGGEEVAQQAIQQTALGEPVRFDESMQESFGMGALMGGGIHGGVAAAERVAREGLPRVGFTVEDVSKQAQPWQEAATAIEALPKPLVERIDEMIAYRTGLQEDVRKTEQLGGKENRKLRKRLEQLTETQNKSLQEFSSGTVRDIDTAAIAREVQQGALWARPVEQFVQAEWGSADVPADVQTNLRTEHRAAVRDALAKNKPVPETVLQDYPDLVQPAPPPAPPAAEAPTVEAEATAATTERPNVGPQLAKVPNVRDVEQFYGTVKKLAGDNLQGDRVIVKDLLNSKTYAADSGGRLYEFTWIKGSGSSTRGQNVATARGDEANYEQLDKAIQRGFAQVEHTSYRYDDSQDPVVTRSTGQAHAAKLIIRANPVETPEEVTRSASSDVLRRVLSTYEEIGDTAQVEAIKAELTRRGEQPAPPTALVAAKEPGIPAQQQTEPAPSPAPRPVLESPAAGTTDPLAPFRRDVARAKDETVQRWLADYQARGADPERITVLQQEAEKRGLTTGAEAPAPAETIAPNVEPETATPPTDSPVSSSSPLATPREPGPAAPAGETAREATEEPTDENAEFGRVLVEKGHHYWVTPTGLPAWPWGITDLRTGEIVRKPDGVSLRFRDGQAAWNQVKRLEASLAKKAPEPTAISATEEQAATPEPAAVAEPTAPPAESGVGTPPTEPPTAEAAPTLLPDYTREEIDRLATLAERLGIADEIERLTAEGLVAREVAARLRGRVPNEPDVQRNLATMVRAVRIKRGIPSQMEPEAFAAWQAEHRATAPAEEPEGEPGITKLLSPVAAETEPVNPDEAPQEAATAEPAKTGTEITSATAESISAPAETTNAAPTPKRRRTKAQPVVGEVSSPDASLVPVAPPPEPPTTPPTEAEPEPTEAPRAGQRDLFRDGIDANVVEMTPALKDRFNSLWNSFRREFEDRNRDVYVFEHLYEQLTNSTLSQRERVSTYLALKPGAARAANLLLKDEYRPILQKVVRGAKDKKESQGWLDDFQTILIALDQVDKDAAVKERWVAEHTVEGEPPPTPPDRLWSWKTDPRLATETLKEVRDGSAKRAGVGAERFDVLMDAAKDYWKFMAKVLAVKRDAGLISAEDYTLLTEKFPHYSPIRILAYLRDSAAQTGTGTNRLSVAQNGIKHLTDEGTNKALQNPLEAAIDLVYQTYGLAARNRAAIQVARMADRTTAEAVPGLDSLIREVPESYHVKANEAVMSAMDNGKRRRFVVPAEMRDIVESGDNQLVGFVALFARVLTEPLRMGATGLNALFLPTNTIGDFVTYMVREPTASPWQYLKAAREVFTEGEAYKAMIRAGVGVGFYEHEANRRETVRQMVNGPWYSVHSVADLGKLAKGLVTLRPVAAAGTAVESIPRLATYMGRRARGESEEVSALASRRISMDFSRGGRTSMFLNQFVPFTNVAFQAPWQVIRSFHEQGNWLGVSLRLATLVVLPTLLAEAWNDLHPEYEDVPDYIKNRSIVVMMPWSGQKKDRLGNPIPEYVEIRAREWSPFVMLAREGIDGFKKENRDGWGKFVAAVMQNWSPVQGAGGAEVVSSGLPPLAATLLEIGTNKDLYRGGPIVPEAREHLPAAEQYQPWTTETAKAIGRAIGVPPAQIDHFVQGNFAGLGKQALGAGDLVLASVGRTPSSRPVTPKPGEQLWAWWVPKGAAEPEMRAESDIARLTAEANRGAGALYVVAGKDEQSAKDKVYAKEYVKTVGEQRPVTQIPLVGNLAQTVYGTRAGQQAQDRQAAADRVLGKGTAAATRRAWEMARPKLDQITEEERTLERALQKGSISGNEWREQRGDLMTRKRGILEGVGAAFPAAAMIGEKATKYKEAIATLAGSVPDRREQTEVLAAIYLAMEPPKAANGLPDMDAFFKSRDLYMEALDPAQRVALEQHLSKNASPTERAYYAAQEAMGEYMDIPRWIGVTKEKSDQMVEAQRQMLAISQTLPPKATNKQARAIVLLAKQDKDMAKLALESTKRKRNPARNLFRYKHPEIERFYSDLLRAESVPEVAA